MTWHGPSTTRFQGGVGFQNTLPSQYEHDLVTRALASLMSALQTPGTHNLKMGLGVEKTVNK
jgi:hypothetical protein